MASDNSSATDQSIKPSVDEENVNKESEEVGISMVDVLEEEQQLEDDANAVLGAGDIHNCTYPQGSVGRQPLYACRTCINMETTSAGVCLACSLDCHEGHDLVELYTKRNFRCDCGNSKFGDNKCKIYPDKSQLNEDNHYNQNFKGVYCTCSRPYPDPEDEVEDEMIQCIICEDWHHGRHLGNKIPHNEDYEEMICTACMETCSFLWQYVTRQEVKIEKAETSSEVDVVSSSSSKTENEKTGDGDAKPETPAADSTESLETGDDSVKCRLKVLPSGEQTKHPGATFWPGNWRKNLCRCPSCVALYTDQKVEYLLDDTDTVTEYEARGKAKQTGRQDSGSSRYDQGMAALSQMDRTAQVEVLHEYNDLKTELKDYLAKFAANGKMVREEDIKEFFSGLAARKKQKKSSSSMQYFCR